MLTMYWPYTTLLFLYFAFVCCVFSFLCHFLSFDWFTFSTTFAAVLIVEIVFV